MKHLAILFAAGLLGEQTALAQTSATVEHEQLSFAFGDFTAGGQLDYPADVAHAPVVVLIPGSGPEDRNADIGTPGQPPSSHIFLDIADALTARGFAVMRYDKHYVSGYGEVDYQSFYTKLDVPQMLADAETVLLAAESDAHVDPQHVFLYGWSEGSTVAAALAVKHPELAGVIFQGAVVEPWRELFEYQAIAVAQPYLRSFGSQLSPADLQRANTGDGGRVATQYLSFVAPGAANGDYTIDPSFDVDADGKLDVEREFLPALETTFDAAFQPDGVFAIYAPERALPPVLDHAPALSRVPTLLLQGGRDANVPPTDAVRFNAALHLHGGDHALRLYPGLGHSLGRTRSRLTDDFQPIDAQPLSDLARWLTQQLQRGAGAPAR